MTLPITSEELYLINLKNYKCKNYQNQSLSIWHKLPSSRRSLVFILLFIGKLGELRVVLTKRSSKLRSFPGHISLPGGNSDNGLETEWDVSRREMFEEIGINENNNYLLQKFGFKIDHINTLPCFLSRTFSAVKPCIGFMNFDKINNGNSTTNINEIDLINNLKLTLNPGESSSVFSCPLRDFLYPIDSNKDPIESIERTSQNIKWGGIPWKLRSYIFKQNNLNEPIWLNDIKDLSASEEEDGLNDDGDTEDETEKFLQSNLSQPKTSTTSESKTKKKNLSSWGRLGSRRDSITNEKIVDVWGLTADILHHLSDIVYNQSPSNEEIGQEELIYSIWKFGNQMKQKRRSREENKLIKSNSNRGEFGFNDILPRIEFNNLKKLYKANQ